jgi:hypothetical protein
MPVLTADAELKAVLARIKEYTEIRDDGGNLLGYFQPSAPDEDEIYRRAAEWFDPVESKRRKEETGGFTIEQIMERFKAMEASE